MSFQEHNHPKLNDSVLLRDGELFNRKSGFGFFSADIERKYYHLTGHTNGRIVWLPRETDELVTEVREGNSMLIVGGLGDGKSALLYGLRSTLRDRDDSYLHVDGHFSTSSVERIEAALEWAKKNGAIVSWDSLDYLIGKSRRVRKLGVVEHTERTHRIAGLIGHFMDEGGIMVGTSHSEPWLQKYGDPQLIFGPWTELTSRMNTHNVKGLFEKPEELIQFYHYAGLDDESCQYLAYVPTSGILDRYLGKLGHSQPEIEEMKYFARCYRIAKLLVVDKIDGSEKVLELLPPQSDREEDDFAKAYIRFIEETNKKTNARMGLET